MPVSRTVPAVVLLSLLTGLSFVTPSLAADRRPASCLTKTEQRAAIDDRKAVPLAQAIRSLRAQGRRGEVVRAELCRRGDDLVYVLTLLARNGKVTRVTVDAANGALLEPR